MCLTCNKGYSHRQSVIRHVPECGTKPDKVPHLCIICSKAFKYKSDLQRHMKTHEKKGDLIIPSFTATSVFHQQRNR